MIEINKNDLKNPTESGWYICKYAHCSVAYFKDEDRPRDVNFCICTCDVKLLYWEQNVWLPHPRSYNVLDERNVLSWEKIPKEFNICDEQIKVNY